jgi:REP element-mobilizing transposase RayT
VGTIKGSSSTRINESGLTDGKFYWQSEYSIFTVSEFRIPKLKKYITNQKIHPVEGSIQSWLELKNKD